MLCRVLTAAWTRAAGRAAPSGGAPEAFTGSGTFRNTARGSRKRPAPGSPRSLGPRDQTWPAFSSAVQQVSTSTRVTS